MIRTELQAGKRLADKSPSGKLRPWEVHKLYNGLLALAYDSIDARKAERLRECASVLGFVETEGGLRLEKANFCRVRLCPTCTWRRSLKLQAQMHGILDAMNADKAAYAYVYMTLTVRNCTGDKLSETLDSMMQGYQRLMQSRDIKRVVLGWFRSMEITHNVTPDSPDFDTYHPHFHVVLAVKPSYFSGRNYLPQARVTELWARSMRLDYTPVVDVRKVRGETVKAVAEAAGYSTKSSSFIIPEDWDLTEDTVRLLDAVLSDRRFVGYGGVMRDYHRKLEQDDPEDGDLIHVDGEKPPEAADGERRVYYAWFSGYRQYREVQL